MKKEPKVGDRVRVYGAYTKDMVLVGKVIKTDNFPYIEIYPDNLQKPKMFHFKQCYLLKDKIQFPNFVKIKAGSFMMGSFETEKNRYDNEQIHIVSLSQDFEMMETPVTQKFWKQIVGTNPSYFKGNNLPVECVSWDDCQDFIKKMNSKKDGYTYRLPTEAEWEYAARAGTSTAYYFGDDATQLDANGWYSNNSGSQTHAVGSKTANAFGLYDMAGNVWEWMQDWYGPYSNSRVTDPTGAPSGSFRVLRGGGWYGGPQSLRSAWRNLNAPANRNSGIGFRVCRTRI